MVVMGDGVLPPVTSHPGGLCQCASLQCVLPWVWVGRFHLVLRHSRKASGDAKNNTYSTGAGGDTPMVDSTRADTPRSSSTQTSNSPEDEISTAAAHQSVNDSYAPMWFDRMKGYCTTYHEGIEFCARQKLSYIPCPYNSYCPLGEGSLPTPS